MIKSSVYCPVPDEQQPVNEYEQLKISWLYRDCFFGGRKYFSTIAWVYSLSWLIAGPVAAASFPPHKHLLQFLLTAAAGACIGILLLVVRLYLGWSYISERLSSQTVFYEESGWYDGQVWDKPEEILARDRLIVSYEIRPILHRLQITFAALFGFLVVGTITWQFL
jgi:Conserved in the green lineage and diatoms 27